MKKVLILHSNLRGSISPNLVNKYKTNFPNIQVVPILFFETEKGVDYAIEQFVVTPKTLSSFTREFDFSDVIAVQVSFMTGSKFYFVKHIPQNVMVLWGIPGGDLYNRYLRYFGYELYYNKQEGIKYRLGSLYRSYTRRKEFNYLMQRCSAVLCAKCDYDLILKYCPSNIKGPQHIYSIAYQMDKALGDLYNQPFIKHERVHAIIGNSASRSNNHLYVLSQLLNKGISDFDCGLLLSYGDSDDAYKQMVKTQYYKEFTDRVTFITDFVPLSEFNTRLLNVSHFLYGNWRQESVGNILTAFYLGGKVYLSRKNPLLDYFRGKGFVVYCLEDIDHTFYDFLSERDKHHNRSLIESQYTQERSDLLFKTGLAPFYGC